MRSKKEIIRLTLMAVANLEGWDAEHPSIKSDADGWQFENGLPVPSAALLAAIRKLELEGK